MLVGVSAFGASVAASFVPPETLWVLQLFGIFSFHISAALGSVIVGALLMRVWRTALALSVVLLVGLAAPRVARNTPPPADMVEDAPGLGVMTFNAQPSLAGSKQDALAGLLARDTIHLFVAQELPLRYDRDTGGVTGPPLITPLMHQHAFAISWPTGERNYWLELPIFSRLDAATLATLPVGEGRRGVWRSGGIVRNVYAWQGDSIAVYNVHLHSFDEERPWGQGGRKLFSPRAWRSALRKYKRDFDVRAEQARQLRVLLEAETLPFLVCGDFNSTPGNWVYAHISEGLRDVFRAAGHGWGATYPALRPFFRIDFVFASPEWEVRRARVEETLSSDHRPVIAELALGTVAEAD